MFVLLKILLYFLRPLIWIIILFIAAILTKRPVRKKRLCITGVILLLIFSNPFLIHVLVASHEGEPAELHSIPANSTGILLGGFVGYNNADRRGYFNAASDRLIQTALLYKQNRISKIIIAAGNGYLIRHDFVEADFAKQQLVQLGIPADSIIAEGRSKNTEENAINSKKIIDSLQLHGPFVLVTSAFHMQRAKLAFEKEKINVIVYPCDFTGKQVSNNFFEDYLLPSSSAFKLWDNYIKEIVGIAVYKMKN